MLYVEFCTFDGNLGSLVWRLSDMCETICTCWSAGWLGLHVVRARSNHPFFWTRQVKTKTNGLWRSTIHTSVPCWFQNVGRGTQSSQPFFSKCQWLDRGSDEKDYKKQFFATWSSSAWNGISSALTHRSLILLIKMVNSQLAKDWTIAAWKGNLSFQFHIQEGRLCLL